jgi:putative DNA primase/helicase
MSGWLRGLERQGRETDRGFFLEAWNGTGSYTYDRIGRGTVFIPATCVSILGSIQPGPLAKYLRNAITGAGDDGLVSRFQVMIYPDTSSAWRNVDRWPDTKAKNEAFAVYTALASLDPDTVGAERDEHDDGSLPFVRFDSEAQQVFDDRRGELEVKLRSGQESPYMESHLAKYRSLLPSLALLWHLAEFVSRQTDVRVSAISVRRAAAWCDYLEAHARRVYGCAYQGDVEPAQRLGERIRDPLHDQFTNREVVKKGWTGLDTADAVERAVNILEEHDWVRVVEKPTGPEGGRPSSVVAINPRLVGAATREVPA